MKAAVYDRYGPPEVVRLTEVAKPTPRANEILIRIHATTVSSADWRLRSLSMPPGFGAPARLMFGVARPRQPILGSDLAGEIEAVGGDVRKFKPGDRVVAQSGARMRCHAQYRCLPEGAAIAPKPPKLGYDEAAALVFGGTTALDFLRRGKVQAGERVLVNGASGAVGTAAVQLAKHMGAEVTAVCSGANAALVRSLGAAHVIDYTKDDFAHRGERYDVIVDTCGTAPFARSKHALAPHGRLLLVLAGLSEMLRAPWVALTGKQRIIAGPAAERAEDVRYIAELAQSGEFKPVIDRRYPLEQIVEAHRYVDSGRKRGSVVITIEHAA